MNECLWLIPALPLAAFLLLAMGGRALPPFVVIVTVSSRFLRSVSVSSFSTARYNASAPA